MSNLKSVLPVGGLVALALLSVAGQASGQATCGSSIGPDVIVGDITGPSNYTAGGGLDALSLGTTSCNMGNAKLRWDAFPAATHPAIGGNLYKFKTVNGSGRFEQIGMSWLKHGFTALTGSVCCTCQPPSEGGSRLGIGCSDPYTSGRNGSQSGLGPRWQVNAHTGVFPTSGPANPAFSGATARRLEVAVADLEVSSASVRYFGESQYITPDDATANNQNNNASYKEMTVTGAGDFSFAFGGALSAIHRQLSAIEAWALVDTAGGPVTTSSVQVTGDGKYIVASKATALTGGMTHYEYAVYNMNGDCNVGTFSVPVSDCVTVTNIGFHGVTYRNTDGMSGTSNFSNAAWTSTRANGLMTFATQAQTDSGNANAIRWGTTYNFRFDANVAPVAMLATIGMWKTSCTTPSATGAAQVPGQPACIADTDNGSGAGVPDGGVGIEDLLYYLNIYNAGVVAADVDDGSGRCVRDGGVGIEDLLYYLTRYNSGC